MDDFEKEEFWKGLSRLYDATQNLKTATENLLQTAQAHERRLDRVEVTNEAIREDLRAAQQALERIERKLGG